MNTATQILDDLLGQLEKASDQQTTNQAGDAINDVLQSPARTTAVRSLRDAPEIATFRDELIDGLIRADTANRLLRLVAMVVERLV